MMRIVRIKGQVERRRAGLDVEQLQAFAVLGARLYAQALEVRQVFDRAERVAGRAVLPELAKGPQAIPRELPLVQTVAQEDVLGIGEIRQGVVLEWNLAEPRCGLQVPGAEHHAR